MRKSKKKGSAGLGQDSSLKDPFRRYVCEDGELREADETYASGRKHFSVILDSEGREIRREDYDDQGRLRKVKFIYYGEDGAFVEEFYDAALSFFRERNTETGLIEERGPEGNLLSILRTD